MPPPTELATIAAIFRRSRVCCGLGLEEVRGSSADVGPVKEEEVVVFRAGTSVGLVEEGVLVEDSVELEEKVVVVLGPAGGAGPWVAYAP